ncbi:MAG: hypothetical protein QF524_08855, partial [Planctomycetota bacterium]|nr:hypothetical protein [Planctomycetota bacterium]
MFKGLFVRRKVHPKRTGEWYTQDSHPDNFLELPQTPAPKQLRHPRNSNQSLQIVKKATLKLTCALLISLPACASHVMVKDAHFNEGAVLSEDTSKDFWWPKHPQSKKNTNPDRMNLIDDGTLGVGDKIQLEYSR